METQDEVKDILAMEHAFGSFSGRVIRWGITVAGVVVVAFIIMGILVRYPDTLSARATITTPNPPVEILVPVGGKLEALMVEDKVEVEEGQVLAVMKDASRWRDVIQLEKLLAEESQWEELLKQEFELGRLEPGFQEVILLLRQQKQFEAIDITADRIRAIQEEIRQITELNSIQTRQQEIFDRELANLKVNYERNRDLFEQGVLSKASFEVIENEYLARQREREAAQLEIVNNSIRVERLRANILDLRKDQNEEGGNLYYRLQQKVQTLRADIEGWRKSQLIIAPIAGTIAFPLPLQEGVFLVENMEFATVVPSARDGQTIAYAQLPAYGAGSVQSGQKAILYLDNYPSEKYGTLPATVQDISIIPNEDNYRLRLSLPDEWVTSYGIRIPKQQRLTATASIETNDYSLMERVFQELRSSLDQKAGPPPVPSRE